MAVTAGQLRSPGIVSAAIAVAQATANTQVARVAAFEVLVRQYNNIYVFNTPTPGSAIESCALSSTGGYDWHYKYDGGLPTTLAQQIMTLASAVYHNTSDDPVVRSAAYCVRSALHQSFPFPINTALITLTFVCGDEYRIHNGNAEFADLTWNTYHVPPNVRTVAPTLTNGVRSVPGNADAYIRTDSIATTRLFYKGQLIQTRANGGSACH
jgi:hypothetical protein